MVSKTKLVFSLGVILIVTIGVYAYLNLNGQKNTTQENVALEENRFDISDLPTIPEQDRVAVKDDCFIGGCNGEFCEEEPVGGLCLFYPSVVCYDEAFTTCERQANGQCGWTETSEFESCLENFEEK